MYNKKNSKSLNKHADNINKIVKMANLRFTQQYYKCINLSNNLVTKSY